MAIPTKQTQSTEEDTSVDVHASAAPIRYLSLDDVYSATSPTCVTTASGSSSTLMSKKIKARKLLTADSTTTTNATVLNVENPNFDGGDAKKAKFDNVVECTDIAALGKRPRSDDSIRFVYTRRKKVPKRDPNNPSLFDTLHARVELRLNRDLEEDTGEVEGGRDDKVETLLKKKKKKKKEKEKKKKSGGKSEVLKLGAGDSGCMLSSGHGPRLRENRNRNQDLSGGGVTCGNVKIKTRSGDSAVVRDVDKSLQTKKRWVRLSFDDADPKVFIGLKCKVFWPLDADWYTGNITGYDQETNKHHVKYEDDDEEDLTLTSEKIRFFISYEEMKHLNLRYGSKNADSDLYDYEEMVVLAATMNEYQELEPGDIVWAKLTGHAMWPGIVVDESRLNICGVSDKNHVGSSVYVQFFGTHDFARLHTKQVIPFLKGLISSFHLKCKKPRFIRGLEEARTYLSEQKLPKRMRRLQNGSASDDRDSGSDESGGREDSGEDCVNSVDIHRSLEYLGTTPYLFGDLRVLSLGRIVKDIQFFQDENCIWPEGYTAVRQFASLSDPSISAPYKMEVLRDNESKDQPLFVVTSDKGEQFKGSTPSACWNKIYKRLKKINGSLPNGSSSEGGLERTHESGSHMFGFCDPEVIKLIQGLSKSQVSSKFPTCKSSSKRCGNLPVGYRPVRVDWKDLDKCSVCHMDEEYANNLFLQCDKCRMMVHARCYGELEPVDGVLWLCNLCRPGAPDPPPSCCLCPVLGGAMKPTTDGRWAHLACAMWIPETCLSDVKKMEPIDGISRINKDRWKLLCSICGVSYGACIQCSNNNCRVAYHPLCARAAGLCVELEDEDRLHLLSLDDDEEDQCIRLLSFCKKHRQPSNEHLGSDERARQVIRQCSDYDPPLNPSGCARCEPYNYSRRRGRKEPEALAAASSKRLFVEDQPYLVGGYGQHKLFGKRLSLNETVSKFPYSLQRVRAERFDPADNVSSMAEKYKFMRETFCMRLAFGKSGIHGFGIFAKQPHRAGDMVIEYTGELVRPPIADRREHFIYNSLVGAGTYMFRIDDERVIDATRAGSIAHLINHSCEPNCYSRVISVNGDEHIIIFAKRDIKRWEELTYDYRFFSIDERLACYCGSVGCRGVVNDTEAEEQAARLFVPRSDLIEWKGE